MSNSTCAICFENIKNVIKNNVDENVKNNGNVNKLSCGHEFHVECIDKWKEYNSCPICRKPIDKNKPIVKVSVEDDLSEALLEEYKEDEYSEEFRDVIIGYIPLILSISSNSFINRGNIEHNDHNYVYCATCMQPTCLHCNHIYSCSCGDVFYCSTRCKMRNREHLCIF